MRPRLPHHHRHRGAKGGTADRAQLVPLSLAETRRLLAHLITHKRTRDHIDRWSWWRRRHQFRAKTSHYQRRQRLSQVRLEY
ncbi:hypothetical protein EEZ25_21805 [Micromonospora aurantiaca]|nr:hypothetical protein EEZ25_21805 [Micromonospora aurantiaca]